MEKLSIEQILSRLNDETTVRVDLSYKDLSNLGSALYELHLGRVDFTGSDLRGTALYTHNLYGSFIGATRIWGAVGQKLGLTKPEFHMAVLHQANLTEAHFHDGDLEGMDLAGANLAQSNCSQVNFKKANLTGANLRNADLTWAFFEKANLKGADLRDSILEMAHLCGADIREAKLDGADLSDAAFDLFTKWPDGFNPIVAGAHEDVEWAHPIVFKIDKPLPASASSSPRFPVSISQVTPTPSLIFSDAGFVSSLKNDTDTYIQSLAFHPGKNELAVANGDNTFSIWDIETGEPSRKIDLQGHEDFVASLCYSSDGLLASMSWDNTVTVWEDERKLSTFGLSDEHNDSIPIQKISFTSNNELLLLTEQLFKGASVLRYDLSRNRVVDTISVKLLDGSTLAQHPSEPMIAIPTWSNLLQIWNLQTKAMYEIGKQQATVRITDLAFNFDGWLLACSNCVGQVKVYNVEYKDNIFSLDPAKITNFGGSLLAFHPKKNWLAVGIRNKIIEGDEIQIWNLIENKLVIAFPPPIYGRISNLSFNFDGSILAATFHGYLVTWNLEKLEY